MRQHGTMHYTRIHVTVAVELYHSHRLLATVLISGLWLGWGLS